MSTNQIDSDIQEIKEKLKEMRAENRLVATENRRLISLIQQVDHDIVVLQQNSSNQSSQLSSTLSKLSREIENEVTQRTNARKERKRQILAEIRQKTEENKQLTNQVKALEKEIMRIKQIQDNFTPTTLQSKIKQLKRSANNAANP